MEARYALGAEEADESVRLLFVACDEMRRLVTVAQRTSTDGSRSESESECNDDADAVISAAMKAVIATERTIAPLRFTPSTRGCLSLWLVHDTLSSASRAS